MKRKLFFLLALMLGLVSSIKAQQQDVTDTYLTNANFASGTPIDNGVCTYGKDMAGNNTTYYSAQPIEGWTNASVGETDEGYANSKLAGALFAYGGTPWLAGTGTTAPATDPNGNAGNAAGLCAVWGGSIQYTQDVTLPAGSYTVRFKVYNATTNNGSGKFITKDLFGFVPNEGDAYYAPNKTFAIGQWSTVAVTFNLTEETAGKISMGYVGPSGNANMPHLFVDNVKILKNTYYQDVTNKVGITQADWGGTETNGNKVTTSDNRTINMIADYGQSSGTPMSQTITGLQKGNYEAVVYCYSQMEWKSGGEWLTHDAGDVGYVQAEGTNTIKEWINARRGPGYPADGPGIYCLSDIEVGDAGTLTISFTLDKADRTEWHGLQIQSLIYTKNLDLSGLIAAYEAALSSAKAVAATTERISATVLAALNTTINTYDEGKVDKEDAEALETATSALSVATTNANTSIASYAVIAAGSVPDNSLVGWTCENSNTFHINTWSTEGNPGNDPSGMVTPFIENWVGKGSLLGAGKVYYELAGLEPGEVYYAQALIRSYNEKDATAPNGPDFFINDVTTSLSTAGTTFTYKGMSGIYATLGSQATVGEDGTLTLGVTIANDRNYNWVAFKSVKIQELSAAHAAAVAAAEALEGQIPAAAYNNLMDEIAGYSTVTIENIEKINAAVATYSALKSPYAEFNALKAKAQTMQAVANDNAEANSTLGTAISDQTDAVNAATTAEAINTATSTLKAAMTTYVGAANPVGDGAQFDLTFMLTNPDLTGLPTWAPADGWAGENGGNSQVMQNGDVGGEDHKSWFYEFWSNNPYTSKFNLYLSTTLPKGTYNMECYAFAQCADNSSTAGQTPAPQGVTFSVDETDGSYITSTVMAPASLEFVNKSEKEVKIGLKAHAGNNRTWMGIGYVELYKVPAKTYVVDEDVAWEPTTSGAGDVTLNRTIKVGFNTVVFPFSMTQAEVESTFGADSKVYVVESYNSETDNITFATHDGISANQPCLLQATVAGTSYELEGRTIVAGASAPETVGTGVKMIGSYAASTTVVKGEGNNYVISGGKIYLVDYTEGGVAMKGTRAYIQLTDANGARELIMILDGEDPTAIDSIEVAEEGEDLKDGKYLIDGQIVIVKNGVKYSANGQILK